ncbi:protein SHQ1 homolog isoform X1 [Diorhabda carinulata]|uniref:protein SHQ1 homolog isoform X1 n=1 Tax=Diorhabda carinulata TaxID=1163345 RepID=UPI0025A1A51E|nr:protein SHQ1 homolog isoform X1 [Diorhabda carinulata]
MLTPRFKLSQDDRSITIEIRAPYCSLRELQVEVDENVFLFFCKPYFLRLFLPGKLIENENYRSSFDCESGEFTFTYDKAEYGEHFEDLDFITKFLVTRVETTYENKPNILVIDNEAKLPNESDLSQGFGFALMGHRNFVAVSSEFSEVFEIDPSEVNLKERRKLRLQFEQGKFDMGHYLADYIENEDILSLLQLKTPWNDIKDDDITFSNKELDFLKDLPNINYELSELQIKYVFNGLIDILYAYCYDGRTTDYDTNSESGWTIVKLSATLCWLDAFDNTKDVLISAFRRSVTYPLFRNFELSLKVLEDLKQLLKLSDKYIIKCLIQIYYIFLGGDCCRYILNNLFIKDYIIYIINWDRNRWREFLKEVDSLEIKKEELGFNLFEIEQGFTLENKMENLKISVVSDDSDDESSESSDSDDSSESETESSSECQSNTETVGEKEKYITTDL